VLFIQSTQKNNQVAQAQVLQYQVEANLTKVGDRWLLSGIQGRGVGRGRSSGVSGIPLTPDDLLRASGAHAADLKQAG